MFRLQLETTNAAFDGGEEHKRAEVARLLRETATALERGTDGAPLHDLNGNRVGRFDLTH